MSDAQSNEKFRQTGIVTNAPYVRFYMGIPLVNEDGNNLGTLSVMDTKPRKPNDFQKKALIKLEPQPPQWQHLCVIKDGY